MVSSASLDHLWVVQKTSDGKVNGSIQDEMEFQTIDN